MRKKKLARFLAGFLAMVLITSELPATYAAETGKTNVVTEDPVTDIDESDIVSALEKVSGTNTVKFIYGLENPSPAGIKIKVTYSAGGSETLDYFSTKLDYAFCSESTNGEAKKDSKGYYPTGKYYYELKVKNSSRTIRIPVEVISLYTKNLLPENEKITIEHNDVAVYKFVATEETVIAGEEANDVNFGISVYNAAGKLYASGKSVTLAKGTYYVKITNVDNSKTANITFVGYEGLKAIARNDNDKISFKYGSFGYYVGETVSSGVVKGKEMTTPLKANTALNDLEKIYSKTPASPAAVVSGNNAVSGSSTSKTTSGSSSKKESVSGNTSTGGGEYTFWFDEIFKLTDKNNNTITTTFNSAVWNAYKIVQKFFDEDGDPVKTDENGYVPIGDYTVEFSSGSAKLSVPFSVKETTKVKDFRKATVTGITDKDYTGKALKQKPVVKYDSKTLTEGTDYTVSYKNNKYVGTATVIISGKGKYSGVIKKTFSILATKSYNIAFVGNGATSGTMAAMTLGYGESKALSTNAFVRNGYKFNGWNKKGDGTGTKYKDGATVKNLSKTNGATVKLYAQWSKETYTITYELNGGSNDSNNPTSYTIDSAKITLGKPTKTGYTFAGWYTDSDYSEKITNIPKGSYGNVKLYAKWEAPSYTIKYNGNKATSGKVSSQTKISFKKTFSIKKNSFEKNGYQFTGWNTKADGTGTSYKPGQKVTNLAEGNICTITLYAQWEPVKYTIKYVLKKGKNNKANPTSYYVTTSDIKLKKPTRSGYVFKGWYEDAACTKKVTTIKKGSYGDVVLYAKWKKK